MIKITVMHQHPEIQDGLILVAEVKAPTNVVEDALQYAYRWTQNLSGSWSKKIGSDSNNNVHVLETREDGLGLRSTSVGDRMMFDITKSEDGEIYKDSYEYEVDRFGFKEIIILSDSATVQWEVDRFPLKKKKSISS